MNYKAIKSSCHRRAAGTGRCCAATFSNNRGFGAGWRSVGLAVVVLVPEEHDRPAVPAEVGDDVFAPHLQVLVGTKP